MIRLVTALAAEARPIVSHWRLTAAGDGHLTRFEGDGLELVVSGIGSAAAAAAVGYLAGRGEARGPGLDGQDRHRQAIGWINVGIAGHRDHELGSAWLAAKVVEQSSGRAWYPPLTIQAPCPGAVVRTVAKVERALVEDGLYEMEAAGFYSTATRFATAELVQVLKVVSDNRLTPPERLTRQSVGELIEGAIPALESLIDGTRRLASEVAVRLAPPEQLPAFLERWHFTVTQRRQLERLLRRLAVLAEEPATCDSVSEARSAKEVLARLRRAI